MGRFSFSKIGCDHLPVRISISWEVLARVYSAYGLPERKYETRSAMKISVCGFFEDGGIG